MKLGDVLANRRELDRALGAILGSEKDALLERMGPAHRAGLRVWHFGGEDALRRDPREIPLAKMKEFVRHYTSIAA